MSGDREIGGALGETDFELRLKTDRLSAFPFVIWGLIYIPVVPFPILVPDYDLPSAA